MGPNFATSTPFRHSYRFEAKSAIGRTFFSKKPRRRNGLLNLGCGDLQHSGFCNADFFRGCEFNFIRRILGRPVAAEVDWELDLRFPLNCDADFFDGVFCEHTLEHIDIWQTRALLLELNRVMRKGAAIRISVPDLEKYVAYYIGKPSPTEFSAWASKGEALWSLTHNWGHKCVYDFGLMRTLLAEAGFSGIEKCAPFEGRDKRLLLDAAGRSWESLYVEATKLR